MGIAPRASRLVVSLGGNAILPPGGGGTIREQYGVTGVTMSHVADLLADGHRILLTHGNGPIVGNILIRNEAARDQIPPMPLDVCGADSQGGIGYMIQQTLQNLLKSRGIPLAAATVVTQVVVDGADRAFANPTKPIGPFYKEETARRLQTEKGWTMAPDSGRGWRRVVPSPRPLEVVEIDAIRSLLDGGHVVVAAGGGGIPVVRKENGELKGVEAVIDKDRATGILALSVGVEGIIVVTGVDRVSLNYGTDRQEGISEMTSTDARRHLEDGQFPPGSMGPKIESAIEFLEGGGRFVVITSPSRMRDAMAGKDGTRIIPG